ncbi:MAG TPA: PGPGW domain-containing protein [Pirellulales bacterium]|jgi:hypothetical protein|nr:PGPGW domain-containing protein [Pirellulales bacterium]
MILEIARNVTDWFAHHPWVFGLLMSLSLLTVLATLVIVPWAIVRIPPDYFAHRRCAQMRWEKLHPTVRLAVFTAKNLLGLALLLAGVIMALPLVPGPGILTVLLGLALLDLPGKRAVERWIVAQPAVFASLNKLRAKYGQPPLAKPD